MERSLFYLIYKITNNINGKYYIGKHKTRNINDDYMGSGKYLKAAIKKYGVENFKKEILHFLDSEEEMNAKEKELVVISEQTYNLCPGGQGGFTYIHNLPNAKENLMKGRAAADKALEEKYGKNWRLVIGRKGYEAVKKKNPNLFSEVMKRNHEQGLLNWTGKKHSDESIAKMKQAKVGHGVGQTNSQFGSKWITDGVSNKKIKTYEEIPAGWKQGRSNCAYLKNRSTTHWIGKKHSEETKKKISESVKNKIAGLV